jgi:hypothetical protein
MAQGQWMPIGHRKSIIHDHQTSPDPQVDLIERWQRYLDAARDRWILRESDNELEVRWKWKWMKQEAEFYAPEYSEEVIRCWDVVPETIRRVWSEYKNLQNEM